MHQIYDRGYNKLFSNKVLFRQLLESFVPLDWVQELDFEHCELLDKTFGGATQVRKIGDFKPIRFLKSDRFESLEKYCHPD